MKSVRVVFALVALLALPFGAVAAQGRGKPRVQNLESECKPEHRAAIERARAEGRPAPAGLDKKCLDAPPPPPPPPPSDEQPPTGIHRAVGIVYEDVDGNGSRDGSAGELGLAGWTVQLYWNGKLISSTSSDSDGSYTFPGLANTSYQVCVVGQAGYIRTQPVNGDSCGGFGYSFTIAGSFETWAMHDFGMMMQ
jgi:hypothetical protein